MSAVNISVDSSKRKRVFSKMWRPCHHHTKTKMNHNFLSTSNIHSACKVSWLTHLFFVFSKLVCLNLHPNKPTHLSLPYSYSYKDLSLDMAFSWQLPWPQKPGSVSLVYSPTQLPCSVTLTTGLHPATGCALQEGGQGQCISEWCPHD